MADNVSVLVDFNSGSAGDLISVANLTASTTNASGITATWSLSQTPSGHTRTVSSTALPLLQSIICNSVTHTATSGRAIEYDLDESISEGTIVDQETLSFGTNSVGNVSLGAMTTFNADPGAQIDIFYIYSPFSVTQYRNESGSHSIHAHGTLGGPSTAGPLFDIDPSTPYWISQRCNVDDGTIEVVVQDGTTGAFIGCSRCGSDAFALASMVLGDYLVPGGGSFKHSLVTLAFDALATLPLAPGSFVLSPPPFVIATDGDTDISLDFGSNANVLAFGYKIERAEDGGGSWTVLEANLEVDFVTNAAVSPYVDSTVSVDVIYQYRITALLHAYESAPTYSNYIEHGAAVWYDSVDPVITDTTHNHTDSSRIHSVLVTLPEGTVSKIRVYIKTSTGTDVAFKVALYDTVAGALVVSTTGTVLASSADEWLELIVAPTDIDAASYRVAWAAQANSSDVTYRYKNGTGQTDVSTSSYVAFPDDPFVAPSFNLAGADAVGVYVAPLLDISEATVLNGAPIF